MFSLSACGRDWSKNQTYDLIEIDFNFSEENYSVYDEFIFINGSKDAIIIVTNKSILMKRSNEILRVLDNSNNDDYLFLNLSAVSIDNNNRIYVFDNLTYLLYIIDLELFKIYGSIDLNKFKYYVPPAVLAVNGRLFIHQPILGKSLIEEINYKGEVINSYGSIVEFSNEPFEGSNETATYLMNQGFLATDGDYIFLLKIRQPIIYKFTANGDLIDSISINTSYTARMIKEDQIRKKEFSQINNNPNAYKWTQFFSGLLIYKDFILINTNATDHSLLRLNKDFSIIETIYGPSIINNVNLFSINDKIIVKSYSSNRHFYEVVIN